MADRLAVCHQPIRTGKRRQIHTSIHSHRQCRVSFIWPACLWTVGGKRKGLQKTQTENTQTPKRRQIVTRIFMKCVILLRFITLSLHQNNFSELIWFGRLLFFPLLSLSKKKVMGSLWRFLVVVMNLWTPTYGSYFSTVQLFPHANVVQWKTRLDFSHKADKRSILCSDSPHSAFSTAAAAATALKQNAKEVLFKLSLVSLSRFLIQN